MKYRTAITVEAVRVSPEGVLEEPVPGWAHRACADGTITDAGTTLRIRTPTGDLYAFPGDWIVRTPDGRLSPVPALEFADHYTPAE